MKMATDNHNAKAMEMEEDGPRSRDTPKGTPKGNSPFQNKDKQPMFSDDGIKLNKSILLLIFDKNLLIFFIIILILLLAKGQDIVSIMNSFVLNYPPNSLLTVLSANGTVSIVDIINCDDYTKYHRFLGSFKILSLSWTVELDSDHSPENYGMAIPLKVLLINLETGEVFGGVVQRLVAATTIKMFVGSFKREIGMSFDGASSPSPSIGEVLAELVSNDTPVEDYDKFTHQRSI
ncbi:AT-hook motif nuclear-localized protein 2-like isoform X1 [Cannabis sativa]|uniref:AT-hook motif nuclear-localized protein 2-like isoform X1 n=1 Tax=Cannabis sativa TaxID=3483 RepID=UPI0029C9B5DF|nr:AT-hook motif nuclear-localized protein 2-like isoform X1 [Cannabis sativa]